MKVTPLAISDVLLIEPAVFHDQRGYFMECFNQHKFEQCLSRDVCFVQDNCSRSWQGVVRGLHYQIGRPQGKLVRVTQGEVFDVAVDLRRESPTFGQWCSAFLSADNHHQLWIPEGFAHGFQAVSDVADVQYKTSEYWFPQGERTLCWNDPFLGIEWPLSVDLILSDKDQRGCTFEVAEKF